MNSGQLLIGFILVILVGACSMILHCKPSEHKYSPVKIANPESFGLGKVVIEGHEYWCNGKCIVHSASCKAEKGVEK